MAETENTTELLAEEAPQAETEEIPDYHLPYTGDEVAAAIAKAHRMKFGKVKLTPYFAAHKGTYAATVSLDLSAYVAPICVANVTSSLLQTSEVNLTVDIRSGRVTFNVLTGDSAAEERWVHYIIAEGGNS